MKKLLIINPGSTSTKIAVFEDDKCKWTESIGHSTEELAPFNCVYDQLVFRTELVKKTVEEHGDSMDSFAAIMSRGGNLPPVSAGAYEVTDFMTDCLQYRARDQHASNVGAGIALALAKQVGIKAYIYDAVAVDEMDEINKITGLKGMRWPARGHNLNTRAAALKYCENHGLDYRDVNLIVVHLGGGISINLHSKGHIADFISDCAGPICPERAGGLPTYDVVKLCYSGEFTYDEMMKHLQRKGGMISYFGTADMREIEKRYNDGDEEVKLVYEAMTLSIAKNIAKLFPDVYGKVDCIILTGGIANSEMFVEQIVSRISYLAPIEIIPGENEMQALAEGALRVLNGKEKAKILTPEDDV
ncbi:MAG: butyrate kinase [Bacillota bacterium]|nr:butyrate kinase [Bacillota bacterium]